MLSADDCADPLRKKGSADDDRALGKQVEVEVNARSDAVKPWAWQHRALREGGASIELYIEERRGDTYIAQAKNCEVLVQIFGVLTRLSRTKNTNAFASQFVYDFLLPASP